ncbi:hypothetical protein SLW70_01910 [Flavobacterium sp. NG2]|uniref:hypothetical protein n=1 Tax=Flavobacterium sp. NG2 TaxID=3097547 RepID=UPI002A804D26|nr:hypothetical protein [Flavobacterium sp. NG2]WPR71907.1 hypothetical protein SLW70_01910 [Flavobacterium sp. NG2]
MKKNQIVIALSLVVTILFSIVLQSFHAHEHHLEQLAQPKCHHESQGNKSQFTHQHYKAEACKVCHFAFGSYITPEIFHYQFYTDYKLIPYFSVTAKKIISFSGSLYSLRGPPVL